MKELRFRILKQLSREPNKVISVNALKEKMRVSYGSAYYSNVHAEVKKLVNESILAKSSAGICLNFSSFELTDLLAEIELERKKAFARKTSEAGMLLLEMENYFKNAVRFAFLLEAEKNLKLNRVELVCIVNNVKEVKKKVRELVETLRPAHSLNLDVLILTESEFLDLVFGAEDTYLKTFLENKTVILSPQLFWITLREEMKKRQFVGSGREPIKLTDEVISLSMAGFGYKELGTRKQGRRARLEDVITNILLIGKARRVEAIPALIAKRFKARRKVYYDYLIFLCLRHSESAKLLGLLKILNKEKPNEETAEAIRELEKFGLKTKKMDAKAIKQKMRLYDAY